MTTPQSGILRPVPHHARYMEFNLKSGADPVPILQKLAKIDHNPHLVIGFGSDLVRAVGGTINGLRPFPERSNAGCQIPSTQADLWCVFDDEDPGLIAHSSRNFTTLLQPNFQRLRQTDGFKYRDSRDLSGYIDGTENPVGDDAVRAAFASQPGNDLDGSSFVAVQQWVHDLTLFESLEEQDRDHIIGRRISDNEELDDAPLSAHVKRTAQESFDPEAFLVRRSLPWSDSNGDGLIFVAYGHSFDAFEAQIDRMIGLEDGITDGLFRFSRPITGGYYWCPPLVGNKLSLRALGI